MRRASFNELIHRGKEADERPKLEDARLLRTVLEDNLTKKQKCYIILYYRDGLRPAEIARRCGVNRSTVTRTINRGRQRLLEQRRRTENLKRLTEAITDDEED